MGELGLMISLDAWTVHGQLYLISDGMLKGDHVILCAINCGYFRRHRETLVHGICE